MASIQKGRMTNLVDSKTLSFGTSSIISFKSQIIRGYFVSQGQIVVRGYDRFYNLNEISTLTWDHLKEFKNYKASVKENGCIIFISSLNNELLVTSKSSIGPHAQKGQEWLLKLMKAQGKSMQDLIQFLKGITMVCELIDHDFEEHVLDYSRDKFGLYLHGINVNSEEFDSWELERVEKVAKEFGLFSPKTLEFEDSMDLKLFLEGLESIGTLNGQEIEGFVVRTLTKEGKPFFFKYKFKRPYLMYREFRQVTRHILSHESLVGLKIQFHETMKYMSWVHRKLKFEPNYFDGFLENKGIIRARNDFLNENNHNSEYLYKGYYKSKQELGKILLLPVSIVGSGKSTLGKLLKYVCPVELGHVQSDNMPKRNTANHFVNGVLEAFKSNTVVFADKNNHLFQHRQVLCQKFREKYTNGYILALDWEVEKYDRSKVVNFCKNRILER